MAFWRRRRPPMTVLASLLAAAGVVLALAGCSGITPLGPDGIQFPPPRQLGSPIVVQVMRLQAPAATGGCLAGWVAFSLPAGGGPHVSTQAVPAGPPQRVTTTAPIGSAGMSTPATPLPSPAPPPAPAFNCYRAVGTPVTITTAAVTSVLTFFPPPGEAKAPDLYGFVVAVPGADVAAVTAIIKQAYTSRSVVAITVSGKLWQAPMVTRPFGGQRLQIALLSRNQARHLYRLLVPSG